MRPSTSASINSCSTASATLRRKSPSPAFSRSSASANLSSAIGPLSAAVEVPQLHLSRPVRWPPRRYTANYTGRSGRFSTTCVDASQGDGGQDGVTRHNPELGQQHETPPSPEQSCAKEDVRDGAGPG